MQIHGKCHCGNIALALDWPGDAPEIPARACGCTFCLKHGGVWTSSPEARLDVRIHDTSLVSKYAFGTATATFHVCSRCGTVPLVTSEIDDHLHAVVNVNALENVDPAWLRRGAANFDGEDVASRLARRKRGWIRDVTIVEGTVRTSDSNIASSIDAAAPVFRHATRDDVRQIVRMLADDPLGAKRESATVPLPDSYYRAFEAIDRDRNNELIVVETAGNVIGVLQLTYIPYLTYRGGWRALIEGVRVAPEARNSGIGTRMFEWAIARARERGCHLLQLTSDKARPEAIRFYRKLGFVATHEGFKMHLAGDSDAGR